MNIDWSRVAQPQPDLYDTRVAFELLGRGWPPVTQEAPRNSVPRIFDGAVEVRPMEGPYLGIQGFSDAPLDSAEIGLATELVRRWPEAFRQMQLLMHTFHPMVSEELSLDGRNVRGSASHSFESHLGTMCATVADPVGLAQAFVHELAHTKLRALGVQVESARRLITNDPEELFESPVRKDKPRPMSAIFHAEYSFIHVTQLDLILLGDELSEARRAHVQALLARNLPRVREGLETIRQHIQVDREGRQFLDAFTAWAEQVIAEGEAQ